LSDEVGAVLKEVRMELATGGGKVVEGVQVEMIGYLRNDSAG